MLRGAQERSDFVRTDPGGTSLGVDFVEVLADHEVHADARRVGFFARFREIERRYPDLLGRFVFITGTSEHTDYQGFIDDVKVPVLTKPFDMMNLVRVVKGRLAG